MDGDGDIDVLAAKPGNFFGGGAAVLYRNNGNGSFTQLSPFSGGPTVLVSNIVAADLDNDGDLDVVLGSSGSNSGGVRVYRNNGSLQFTRTFDNGNAPFLWDIHVDDANGDGRPDIIYSLGGSYDRIHMYYNSGNLSSWGNLRTIKSGTNTGDEPRNVHLADIDGDGDKDIMSANYLSNQLSYYPNGGGASVIHVTSSAQTRGPRNIRTGDLNGDGVLDLISTSVLDGKVAWYAGSGGGSFGPQQIIHRYQTNSGGGGDPLGPRGLDVSDYDLDGDLDVFSTSEVGNSVCLHENTGSGSFAQPVIITNRAIGVNLVTTIDMDGDGDLDVVSSSPGDNKIAWYEQLGGGPTDTDGDGVFDDDDAFPNDPSETADTDSDGVGDNADVFPNDPTEVADCDNDGIGDNADRRSADQISQLQAQITQLQSEIGQVTGAYEAAITELAARPTQANYDAVVAERDARPTAEQLAAVEAERDALPTQVAYDAVVAERNARPTAEQLAAVEAERDALPTQAAYDAVAAERDARPTAEQLAAVEAERDALPTQAAYDAIAAERDARFTEDQIRGLSADYTIGLNEAGNVQMKFNLFESADLSTFAPFTVNPDSVSVVDGKICLEFAPTDDAAFFRFSVE